MRLRLGNGRAPGAGGRRTRQNGGSEYPTRDATTAGGATARALAVRRGLPLPDLPRTRPALRRRDHARARVRGPADPVPGAVAVGVFLRMPRTDLIGLVFDVVLPAVGLRRQPHRAASTGSWRSSTRTGSPSTSTRTTPAARGGSGPAGSAAGPSRWRACSRSCSSSRAHTSSSPATTCSPSMPSRAAASSSARTRTRCAPTTAATPAMPRPRGHRARPTPRPRPTRPHPTDTPTAEPTPIGTPVPEVSIAPWDGKQRLNILLIGADTQRGGHNTDTLITVSIDPVTKQVAMFSLPRDTTNVPLPPGAPRNFWGSVYGQKINSLWVNNRNRTDLWPGKKSLAGYTALKQTIGNLYGLDIKYFVEVDFDGFKQVLERARRRHRQRPGPDRRRQLPGLEGPGRPPVHPERPAAHGRHRRRSSTRARDTRPRTSTARRASSDCCSRCASRPTRRRSSPSCPTSSRRSRARSRPTSPSTSSTSCSDSRRRSTRRTSARTSSSPRSTAARCSAPDLQDASRTSSASGPR